MQTDSTPEASKHSVSRSLEQHSAKRLRLGQRDHRGLLDGELLGSERLDVHRPALVRRQLQSAVRDGLAGASDLAGIPY